MASSHTPGRQARMSRADGIITLISAFLLGSLLTAVHMSLSVARYLTSTPQPSGSANFNFLDDLGIYSVLAGGGLLVLIILGVARLALWQLQRGRRRG